MKPNQLDKKCFKYHGYRHFQANCPNRRVMMLKEIQEIKKAFQGMKDGEKATGEKEDKVKNQGLAKLVECRRPSFKLLPHYETLKKLLTKTKKGKEQVIKEVDDGTC